MGPYLQVPLGPRQNAINVFLFRSGLEVRFTTFLNHISDLIHTSVSKIISSSYEPWIWDWTPRIAAHLHVIGEAP